MKFSALNPKITLISIPSPFPSPIAAAFPKLLATCCCCAPSTEKIPHNLQRIYFCLYSDQFESDCRADNLCVRTRSKKIFAFTSYAKPRIICDLYHQKLRRHRATHTRTNERTNQNPQNESCKYKYVLVMRFHLTRVALCVHVNRISGLVIDYTHTLLSRIRFACIFSTHSHAQQHHRSYHFGGKCVFGSGSSPWATAAWVKLKRYVIFTQFNPARKMHIRLFTFTFSLNAARLSPCRSLCVRHPQQHLAATVNLFDRVRLSDRLCILRVKRESSVQCFTQSTHIRHHSNPVLASEN